MSLKYSSTIIFLTEKSSQFSDIADYLNQKGYLIEFQSKFTDVFNLFFNNISENYDSSEYKNIIYNIPVYKTNSLELNISLNEKKKLIKNSISYFY